MFCRLSEKGTNFPQWPGHINKIKLVNVFNTFLKLVNVGDF